MFSVVSSQLATLFTVSTLSSITTATANVVPSLASSFDECENHAQSSDESILSLYQTIAEKIKWGFNRLFFSNSNEPTLDCLKQAVREKAHEDLAVILSKNPSRDMVAQAAILAASENRDFEIFSMLHSQLISLAYAENIRISVLSKDFIPTNLPDHFYDKDGQLWVIDTIKPQSLDEVFDIFVEGAVAEEYYGQDVITGLVFEAKTQRLHLAMKALPKELIGKIKNPTVDFTETSGIMKKMDAIRDYIIYLNHFAKINQERIFRLTDTDNIKPLQAHLQLLIFDLEAFKANFLKMHQRRDKHKSFNIPYSDRSKLKLTADPIVSQFEQTLNSKPEPKPQPEQEAKPQEKPLLLVDKDGNLWTATRAHP